MRLIQLNLLLLLTVIRSATTSPYKNASSGASGKRLLGQVPNSISEIFSFLPLDSYIGAFCGQEPVDKRELRKCVRRNCRIMVDDCRDEDKCKRSMNCVLKSNSLADKAECFPDATVEEILKCAYKADCFTNDIACPSRMFPKLDYPDEQSLVEELANVTWRAVLTAGHAKKGLLGKTCAKLEVSKTKFQLRLKVSVCSGSLQTGACATPYTREFSGNGYQNGSNIKTQLEGTFVLKTTTMHLHFHAIEKKKYAIVTPCQEGPDETYLDELAVLSPFPTFDELLENSDDRQSTEDDIRLIFSLLGEDYNKARRIDARNCTN